MTFRAICVALLLAGLSAGCGTVANQTRLQRDSAAPAFGGVHHDLEHIGGTEAVSEIALWTADVPLSAIGDLVMAPYTVLFTCINRSSYEAPHELEQIPPAAYSKKTQGSRVETPIVHSR